MDINLLLEPRVSESPTNEKSSVSLAPTSKPHGSGPMIGGPVQPAIACSRRLPPPSSQPHILPLHAPMHQNPTQTNDSSNALKRRASQTPHPEQSPAKKQTKWTPEEDKLIIELRGQGIKWDDIAKRCPGRSSTSCRLRYQNYLEKRAIWDEEKKNHLARLYFRYVRHDHGFLWQRIALCLPVARHLQCTHAFSINHCCSSLYRTYRAASIVLG